MRRLVTVRTLVTIASLLVLAGSWEVDWPQAAETGLIQTSQGAVSGVDFNRDIRPILSGHCFACHGPDGSNRQAGLRLDQPLEGRPEIASEIAGRVVSTDLKAIMPPPSHGKPLSSEQIDLLRHWIDAGTPFAEHWSFLPPRASGVPGANASLGQVEVHGSTAVDAFIIAKLSEMDLSLAGPEQRDRWLRRVTFDLTGLPPTLEEIREFVADGHPMAHEKVVDRLLASPRFGEHWGRIWLDLVRYGDTHGLHLDNYREMWPYRDWVIRAYNDNMPYDRFITEQIAGDLITQATLDQQIASGFNRLHVTTSEGGSIYEEVEARNVIDRTESFSTIFMGLTAGCAVCHDHKFDPISQRDFYSLSAFFNSLDGLALDGDAPDHPPTVRVASFENQSQLLELDKQLGAVDAELHGPLARIDADQQRWAQQISNRLDVNAINWKTLIPSSVKSTAGTMLEVTEAGHVKASGPVPEKNSFELELPIPAGISFQQIRLDIFTDSEHPHIGRSESGDAVLSELEVEVRSPETGNDFMPVRLVYGESMSQRNESAGSDILYAIDGRVDGNSGWKVDSHYPSGPIHAWFITDSVLGMDDVSQSTDGSVTLRITLKHLSQFAGHEFREFAISVADAKNAGLPVIAAERELRISPWHLAGPFEIENIGALYYQDFAANRGPFVETETFASLNGPIRWAVRDDFQAAGINRLPEIDHRACVNVLHASLDAPGPQSVTLLMGSEDGYQIWLNGQRIAEARQNETMRPLADKIQLPLRSGRNDLFVKLVHYDGPAAFSYGFRSPAVPVSPAIRSIAAKPQEQRSADEQKQLQTYYRYLISNDPDWVFLQGIAAGIRGQRRALLEQIPTTLVYRELAEPRPAYILQNGQYDQRAEMVDRDVFQSLPRFPADAPRNRLGLAQWLIQPGHPLTARVAVNRFWQQIFGVGLVKTSEDFGSQGTPPSHPELLDFLAIEFEASGWDVKKLLKRLVMTDAYRRASLSTFGDKAVDPDNRWLARGPRMRLEAEMIRDAALLTSGLLVETIGGPSVKPPQPEGLWSEVAYTTSNTANYVASRGADAHRRSAYTFWKRTSAPPQMTIFDAPSRERCTVRREQTNTPLQALMLMNEPQYFESAKQLAVRYGAPWGDRGERSSEDCLIEIYRRVTSCEPTVTVMNELRNLLHDLQQAYRENPHDRVALGVSTAEEAAWVMVCSTILNLDAAITK